MEESSPQTQEPTAPMPTVQGPTVQEQPPAKKAPNMMLKGGAILIGIILIVAAIVGIVLLDNNHLVERTPQEMAYRLSDFPSDWEASDDVPDPPGAGNAYYSNAFESSGGLFSFALVTCQIVTFESVADAKETFKYSRENWNPNITAYYGNFDQCYELKSVSDKYGRAWAYMFQENNVVGVISFISVLGYDMSPEWVEEMVDLQASRIK